MDMSDVFLHGVEVVTGKAKPAPLKLSNQGVIGVIGIAPGADAKKFPLDTPVLIAGSREEAAALGKTGSLPVALDSIFSQCLAQVIVVRVEGDVNDGKVGDGNLEPDVLNNILGGYDAETDAYTGMSAFKVAKGSLGIAPKILIAPGFSDIESVANEMVEVADVLRASVILDGPNTSDADAIKYVEKFAGLDNVYIIDPKVKVATIATTENPSGYEERESSPYVAAVMAKQSYAESPSNNVLRGIAGVSRDVEFRNGDANCRANLLNKAYVSTIIREDGFRVWGNRAASGEFLQSYRIKDYMTEGLNAIFFPHVDRNLTEAKVDYLLKLANKFLETMVKEDGALRYGVASSPADRNTAEQRRNGKLVVLVDYEDTTPMERVTIELNYEAQD